MVKTLLEINFPKLPKNHIGRICECISVSILMIMNAIMYHQLSSSYSRLFFIGYSYIRLFSTRSQTLLYQPSSWINTSLYISLFSTSPHLGQMYTQTAMCTGAFEAHGNSKIDRSPLGFRPTFCARFVARQRTYGARCTILVRLIFSATKG